MKKVTLDWRKQFLVFCLCVVGILGLATTVGARKYVDYYETYNQNKFTGKITNWKANYKYVPDDYYIKYTTHDKYSGAWNYWTHHVYFHFTKNGK